MSISKKELENMIKKKIIYLLKENQNEKLADEINIVNSAIAQLEMMKELSIIKSRPGLETQIVNLINNLKPEEKV